MHAQLDVMDLIEICAASAELPPFPDPPPVSTPGILQQRGQLASPQYPSSQQLYSGGIQGTRISFVPSQPLYQLVMIDSS